MPAKRQAEMPALNPLLCVPDKRLFEGKGSALGESRKSPPHSLTYRGGQETSSTEYEARSDSQRTD